MEEVTKKHILQLSSLFDEYKREIDKAPNNPGTKQSYSIHLNNLIKRIQKKQNDILDCIHSKILFLTLQKGENKKRMIVTNISKEDFRLICINNSYQGYEILDIKEVDTKTYEESI